MYDEVDGRETKLVKVTSLESFTSNSSLHPLTRLHLQNDTI